MTSNIAEELSINRKALAGILCWIEIPADDILACKVFPLGLPLPLPLPPSYPANLSSPELLQHRLPFLEFHCANRVGSFLEL
jgi:hypothetical protein